MLRLTAAIRIQSGLYALLFSSMVAAQGSVVESNPLNLGQSSSSTSSSANNPGNSDALNLLLEQLRQLQAEVQSLRGQVEQQNFELRKLQRDSTNRYTNMDQRLQALESSSNSSVAAVSDAAEPVLEPGADSLLVAEPTTRQATPEQPDQGAPIAGTGNIASRSVGSTTSTALSRTPGRGVLEPAVLSEQQLYQMAYDSVINSNFERSIAEFDQYLSIYPEGRFVTNSHYWKGQAYLYLNRFAEARDSYEMILDSYPDAAKVPDAMYGLGLAYQGLGNIPQARRILNDIKRRFPNTGVANLADTRLLSLE